MAKFLQEHKNALYSRARVLIIRNGMRLEAAVIQAAKEIKPDIDELELLLYIEKVQS